MNTVEIINSQRFMAPTRRQKQLIINTVNAVLDYENVKIPCSVDVTFLSNAKIKKLNREFRNIDSATDVLSFPSGEYPPETEASDEEPCWLGDIAISIERAYEQSVEYAHSFEREIAFLTAHSVLHLLGYDHMKEDEEVIMFAKQEAILVKMGITE